MDRKEAIELVARHMAENLDEESAISAVQDFFGDFIPDELSAQLDPILRAQHESRNLPTNIIPSDPRYEPVILHRMKRRLKGVTNRYLGAYLYGQLGISEPVSGRVPRLLPCPACGYATFAIRGNWDTCPVCGWKSDPMQEAMPDDPVGANGVSLKQARRNFAETGTCSEDARDYVQPHGRHMFPRVEDPLQEG